LQAKAETQKSEFAYALDLQLFIRNPRWRQWRNSKHSHEALRALANKNAEFLKFDKRQTQLRTQRESFDCQIRGLFEHSEAFIKHERVFHPR